MPSETARGKPLQAPVAVVGAHASRRYMVTMARYVKETTLETTVETTVEVVGTEMAMDMAVTVMSVVAGALPKRFTVGSLGC
jgi:hypothetical protein